MPGKRFRDVMKDNNVTRFASYFNSDMKAVKKLENAFHHDDTDEMRSIISSHSNYEFIDNLMIIYDPVVKELAKKILNANTVHLTKEGKRQARIGDFKPDVEPVRRKPKTTAKVEQIQSSGKEYERSKPSTYSRAELTFLRNNVHLKNKELVNLYNKFLPSRSSSSILSKKYRLIKSRKGKKK